MYNILTEQEQFNMMNESAAALRKMKNEKVIKRDTLKVLSENLQNINIGNDLFESFPLVDSPANYNPYEKLREVL